MGRLLEAVKNAVEQDNTIIAGTDVVHLQPGHSEEHFAYLGLSRNDLKKLENRGLAIRGYTKNVWLEGEMMPNKRIVPKGVRYHGSGSRVRWMLLAAPMPKEAAPPEVAFSSDLTVEKLQSAVQKMSEMVRDTKVRDDDPVQG
jgi:hypothetical protein